MYTHIPLPTIMSNDDICLNSNDIFIRRAMPWLKWHLGIGETKIETTSVTFLLYDPGQIV